mmetsp:Transcript_9205/g.15005  ORF Transcript_9205/g.15005 Transcript_9205/m.15005 type:complete len:92 (-) Transcript_9205:65-340(-)
MILPNVHIQTHLIVKKQALATISSAQSRKISSSKSFARRRNLKQMSVHVMMRAILMNVASTTVLARLASSLNALGMNLVEIILRLSNLTPR